MSFNLLNRFPFFCKAGISLRFLLASACMAESLAFVGKAEPLQDIPFDLVTLDDSFWLPRLEIEKKVLIPLAFERTQSAVDYLQAAADVLAGRHLDNPPRPDRYGISDLFKVMEGASYLLSLHRDPSLEAKMDHIIDVIGASQTPDGYIYPAHIIGNGAQDRDMGPAPYSHETHSHELYNVGHLYEAGVAYFRATGKGKLLDICEKNARHVNRVFFVGDPKYNGGKPVNQAPGHEEIELALVKLYEQTHNPLYLEMSKKFLEIRGVTHRPDGAGVMAPEYAQQQAPVLEQTEAVGHAVRATYLYSGMADVGRLTNDSRYGAALDKIWHNIVDTRMHITGGLGAIHGIEGFGPEYALPNADAYNETCAAVGNVFFNNRMFLNLRDAKYLDVAEAALYNNVLAGVSFSGDRFYYVNPLEVRGATAINQGSARRAEWFRTACCPTNLSRLLPQISGMIYATGDNDIYVAFYIGSATTLDLGGTKVGLKQKTEYPFDGHVQLDISPATPKAFALRLRIPTWTGDSFVPGSLYPFASRGVNPPFTLTVNGRPATAKMEKGFAIIQRTWNPGDKVQLNLAMPVRFARCDERVKENIGRVAVTRGPLVYCAEQVDSKGDVLNDFLPQLPQSAAIQVTRKTIVPGAEVPAVSLPARQMEAAEKSTPAQLTLVPYYAWSNRDIGSMQVWFPTSSKDVEFSRGIAGSPFKSISASHTNPADSVEAMIDAMAAKGSNDSSIPRWTSWDHRGEPQTVEAQFREPTPIRSIGVYWYDDGGGVQLPEDWSVELRVGETWMPLDLYVTDAYQVRKDQLNIVHPSTPITAEALRVRMTPKPGACVGILELDVQAEH